MVYKPSAYPPCAFSQTESISFHSTKRITAYAFTSKAHGSARVEWSTKPAFAGNLTVVQVPGEVTVSRSATYQQGVAGRRGDRGDLLRLLPRGGTRRVTCSRLHGQEDPARDPEHRGHV